MTCAFCHGSGGDPVGETCSSCNGTGKLCDHCGMPISSDEPDTHIHRECLAILRADRRRDEEKDEPA